MDSELACNPTDRPDRRRRVPAGLDRQPGRTLTQPIFEFVEPERLGEVLILRLARRIPAAVAAIGRGGVYLEDGVAPPAG
ncbi:hypothetical protein GCM10027605_44810 [Micromonospora zhanjiangensis]